MKTYYSSHDGTSTWAEWWEKEVCERENYSAYEASKWAAKYHICNDDMVKWVTPDKAVALSYRLLPFDEGFIISKEELGYLINGLLGLSEYSETQGFIIPESDDGDDGFIFVFRAKWKPKTNDFYYYPSLRDFELNNLRIWTDDEIDNHLLSLGLVFRTQEEAAKVGKIMLKAAASISS